MIIYVPKTLEAEIQQSFQLSGFFTVELIDAKTGLVKRRLEFPNLITNAALNAIGSTSTGLVFSNMIAYMGVGTSGTAPAVTDTTLGAELVRTNFTQGFADASGAGPSNAYRYYRVTRVFTELQANGNLTELGMFKDATSGTMWTRQLFKDGAGTPTVLTKTSADQLRVTYEYRLNIPNFDNGGSINISGVSYTWTTRAYHADTDWAQAITLFPGNAGSWNMMQWALETDALVSSIGANLPGTDTFSDSRNVSAYVSGNFYRDVENVWEPGTANYTTGVGSVITNVAQQNVNQWARCWQTVFSPKIPKTNVKRLKLTFRHNFARVP